MSALVGYVIEKRWPYKKKGGADLLLRTLALGFRKELLIHYKIANTKNGSLASRQVLQGQGIELMAAIDLQVRITALCWHHESKKHRHVGAAIKQNNPMPLN
jgi:hypothetical protein